MGDPNIQLPIVFDDLNVGITLHHPSTGEILDVNEQLERLYGYSSAEIRSMKVEDYTASSMKYTQEEAVDRIRAAAAGEPQSFEWQIERANGELRWVSVNLTATTISGVQSVCAEITDITEYKTRELLLQLLTRVVRHNLRNDMSVLIGYAERLKNAIEDDRLEEEIETILDVATEVGNLSDSINEIEQITNPSATRRSPKNLRDVIQDRIEMHRSKYPECELSIEDTTDVWVTAGEGLHYAIDHAIRNAVEHNDHDRPMVTVTVDETVEHEIGTIRIIDNGPSIPDMEIDALNVGTETSSTYHGSGVGLWVMKWCVDSLGGDLTFEENSPRGNIVSLSFPQTRPEADTR
ncbi:PAS domain-containing sensor histidine kinase [Halobacteria archaeon AArc-m2/3/4]|uniref:histidine kinase n=1 Tax=Natronoglomus mannanivorans TaxID=2979990 RepID=A0ABT2QM29_9EURY|nr:PAS domain-containing sensor histidine kinase [Halobacteria archaeon AArc-m2/3/4]